MARRRVGTLIEDHTLILNPVWRSYFGKTGGSAITGYDLLLVHIYKILYSKIRRTNLKNSYVKDEFKTALPPAKGFTEDQWAGAFHTAVWNKVRDSRMLTLKSVPRDGEDPTSQVLGVSSVGDGEIKRIQSSIPESNYTRKVSALMEETMNLTFKKIVPPG